MDRMINARDVVRIGKRLRELRLKLGLTQYEFSEELFWEVSSYQKIENGKAMMTTDKAIQLHRKYNIDLNYFLANDPLPQDDELMHMVTNESKERSTKMIIRILEYLIKILKRDVEEEEEEA